MSTAKKVSSAAAKILRSRTASKAEKAVAASAMTQTKTSREDHLVLSAAAKILKDPRASKEAKSVMASALVQKPKKSKEAKRK